MAVFWSDLVLFGMGMFPKTTKAGVGAVLAPLVGRSTEKLGKFKYVLVFVQSMCLLVSYYL